MFGCCFFPKAIKQLGTRGLQLINMKPVTVLSAGAFLLLLCLAGLTAANPIEAPMVKVESPINNHVYPTSDVEFKISPLYWYTYSEYYFVLDDQTPMPLNGTVTLTGLSAGSHIVKIYGNGTLTINSPTNNQTSQHNSDLLSVVYFSVFFSTAWVTFGAVILVAFTVVTFTVYKKRLQIKTALRGEKNAFFSIGLVMFVLSSLSFVFFALIVLENYLFPHWPQKFFTPNYNIPFVLSLFFLSLGLFVMWLSCKRKLFTANSL
jgi:hypothetical protein